MNSRLSRGRLLIVDDEAADRRYLREALQGADYEFLEASEASQALDMAAELAPDLLILDARMPGTDGYAVFQSLRDDPLTAAIPVIMVSALCQVEDRLRGLESGATEYLVKPIDPVELSLRVGNLLRQQEARRRLEQELGECQRQEQLRDEWTTYVVRELDQLLESLPPSLPSESPLKDILNEVQHLASAIAGCRELSQPRAQLTTASCDLTTVVHGLEQSIQAQVDTQELHGAVQADAHLLRRLFQHLIRISAQLSINPSEPIRVSTLDDEDDQLTVQIETNGSGMWHASFDVLSRGNIVSQGLDCRSRLEQSFSFCRHTADLMGGQIGVESATENALRFWFKLPRETSVLPSNVIPLESAAAFVFDSAASR